MVTLNGLVDLYPLAMVAVLVVIQHRKEVGGILKAVAARIRN